MSSSQRLQKTMRRQIRKEAKNALGQDTSQDHSTFLSPAFSKDQSWKDREILQRLPSVFCQRRMLANQPATAVKAGSWAFIDQPSSQQLIKQIQ